MQYKELKKLQHRKYREKYQRFLIEGEHLVLELEKAAVSMPILRDSILYVTDQYHDWPTRFKKVHLTESQMSQLAETKNPQGIIACVPFFDAVGGGRKHEKAVYLHEVQDPGNLGTILRSLAWFGDFRCLLSPGSVDPYHAKVLRASMGAVFHVPIELDVDLHSLADRYASIACLDVTGKTVTSPEFGVHDCYLFGNEARGLPEEIDLPEQNRFTIAGSGLIDSLNLAASVNICLYELKREA